MTRKLILLDLLLIAAIAGMVWRFREQWQSTEKRQQAVLARKIATPPPPPLSPLPPVQPSTAAAYGEIAQKMLFTRDRNPAVVVEVTPPKPMPPLPSAYGVMDLGDGPTAFLSEKDGTGSKPYRVGDTVGDFKLLAMNKDEITFEWDGKTIKKRMEELAAKPAQPPANAAPAPRPAAGAAVPVPQKASGPGVDTGGGYKACVAGDTTPNGAVVDGFRKVLVTTPFGQSCRWDPVR